MIKVCHVTSVHPATDVRIFWKECISLCKRYNVCLIAPNTPEREEHGIHIYTVKLPQNRIIRQNCLNKVFDKMIDVNADVYHLHDPELMRLGIKIKKRGKKVIFDSHEDVPMQILCKEYLPKWTRRPISLIYSWYEKRMLKDYNALITVTPTILRRLSKINPVAYMVTNYPVLDEYTTPYHENGGGVYLFCWRHKLSVYA